MQAEMKLDGEKLRAARTTRFLERQELADKAGIARRTIERMETGEEGGHRLSTIRKLAEALGVDSHELVKDDTTN
jgi:transcriptional regulator with XRE-family HTH domain